MSVEIIPQSAQAVKRAEAGVTPGPPREGPLTWAGLSTPLGEVFAGATRRGLCSVALGVGAEVFAVELGERFGAAALERPEAFSHLFSLLGRYFKGEAVRFDVPLDARGSKFDLRVWGALAGIPRGETRSYGEVARFIGSPGAARAVGRACGRNPLPLVVPCHRVVGASGPGGYTPGAEIKRRLLELEGARF